MHVPAQPRLCVGPKPTLHHPHCRAGDAGHAARPLRQEEVGTALVAGGAGAVAHELQLAGGALVVGKGGDGLEQTVGAEGGPNVHVRQAAGEVKKV